MWQQTLFSKRTAIGGIAVDEYHTLTSGAGADWDAMSSIQRAGRAHGEPTCFVAKLPNRLLVGVIGKVGDIFGNDSKFAYEAVQGKRPIHFTHIFGSSEARVLPDLQELLAKQRSSFEELLERAHATPGKIDAPPMQLSPSARAGTDWAEFLTKPESRTHGALFSLDGKLLKRVELSAPGLTEGRELPKKFETARQGPSFYKVTAIVVGAAVAITVGAYLWKKAHDQSAENTRSSQSR
ncbi:hypothetical protein [Caulobacter mirabilis]|uniref:Uncharacterized protein n=1 Tax=Caulobacter mirabilis TaxID=69666 RepID=A0A2D2AYN0_9CAUL|nr:hypothetical protein [Caulobacter mirabilis]ATQ43126.1 hypothetical protein CSW64_12225 [Caulobacter mirabilis]